MPDDNPLQFDLEQLAARPTTRRGLLAAAGAGGLAAVYGLTAGRARGAMPDSWLSDLSGTVTFGSNASDPVPKAAYAALFKAFTKKTGTKVSVNTVDPTPSRSRSTRTCKGGPRTSSPGSPATGCSSSRRRGC
jgi:multiple sugar transport system substrate-binding protein